MSLYSLRYNHDYQKYIELTVEGAKVLKKEIRDPSVFSDYSREFGVFSFMSEIFLNDNKDATKTFVAADRGYSFLHVWTPIAGDKGSTSTYSCGDNFVMFYNSYGKPFRALTARGFIENIGFNSNYRWSNQYRNDKATEYPQQLILDDVTGNNRNFLQVFDDNPMSNPLLDSYNFILTDYAYIGNHSTIKSWARKNGLKNIGTSARKTKVRNIIVNTAHLPYNASSINSGTEYAKKNKLTDYLTISLNTFVNIAYNIALKPGFNLSIDHLKNARLGEMNSLKGFLTELLVNKCIYSKPQIDYTNSIIELIDGEIAHTKNYT
jgi:hypothetical protein